MGAYYKFYPAICMVKTAPTQVESGMLYHSGLSPEFRNYNINTWNTLEPGHQIDVPQHCKLAGGAALPPVEKPGSWTGGSPIPIPGPNPAPPGNPPPKGPVTGDPPEGKDPCGPYLTQRGDYERLGFSTGEHLEMPEGGRFTPGRLSRVAVAAGATVEPALTGKPMYTKLPRIRVIGDRNTGMIPVADLGTGPGWWAFHSPDIHEFGLRGDSVHPKGRWKKRISAQDLIIHSGKRHANTTGDDADQGLGWGMPTARSRHPARGFTTFLTGDAAARVLEVYPTSAAGVAAADAARLLRVQSALTAIGNVNAPNLSVWRYVDINGDAVAAALVDGFILVATIAAQTEIEAVSLQVITPLNGGAFGSITASIGDDADPIFYLGTNEVHAAGGAMAGDAYYGPQSPPDIDFGGDTALRIYFNPDGDTLDNVNDAGRLRVWFKTHALVV